MGTSIAGYAPVVGEKIKYLMLGGHIVGQDSLTRFYALHVIVLPALAVLMISVHLFRVRKDGGLFWGGVVVPGLLVTALALLPYIDRKRHGVGRWFARERVVANTIFSVCVAVAVIFTVIGSLFRGPNWSWVEPWKNPPAVTEGH